MAAAMPHLPRVLVLAGPTCVGKTRLSLELAKRLNGEVINGDPFQAYRGLDIGTDKIGLAQRQVIPHHLLDILEPTDVYSAEAFRSRCEQTIEGILRRRRLPIIVSGSGFYITWLYKGGHGAGRSDRAVRARIDEELRGLAWSAALERLRAVDSKRAGELLENDFYRLARGPMISHDVFFIIILTLVPALEIAEVTGRKPSDFSNPANRAVDAPFDYRIVFLTRPRVALHRAIDLRCESMIVRGLIQEVLGLLERGVPEAAPALRAIGYSEVVSYLGEARVRAWPARNRLICMDP